MIKCFLFRYPPELFMILARVPFCTNDAFMTVMILLALDLGALAVDDIMRIGFYELVFGFLE
jgi:hypothetical protein